MWDADQAIQFRPRYFLGGKDYGGTPLKALKPHVPKVCQVSTGEKHIAFNPKKKTYMVHLNRRTMSFSKDGFLTIDEAIKFRDQKLAIAPEKEFGKKKLIGFK